MACGEAGISWRKAQALGLALLVLACWTGSASGQDTSLVFTGPPEPVEAGSRTTIWLNVLNGSAREVSWSFPQTITSRVVAPGNGLEVPLSFTSAEPKEISIGPGAFARGEYFLTIPESLVGQVIVEFSGLTANRLVFDVRPPPVATNGSGFMRAIKQAQPKLTGDFDPGQFFKDHISGYEPFYFIAGTESPNAKFQISLKYQLLNKYGPWAEEAPFLKGFHFAYTQTSLWDWNQASAPFLDSSYKPELLYAWERVVGGQPTNWFRLDLQPGLQHESNGKAGEDSRSLNIAYLQPTLTFGKEDRFQFTLSPRAWVYIGDLSDNPDLPDFRGYAGLRGIVGWKRGLQLSALGRVGEDGDKGSVQLDLTYPMMNLLAGNFTVYLHAQYFTGYGESLLLFNQKSSAFRVGFSLYR